MVHPQCLLGFQVFFIAQSQLFLQVLGGCASQFIIAKRQVFEFLGIGSGFGGKGRGFFGDWERFWRK